jgi:PAS domain S-box-containing protein
MAGASRSFDDDELVGLFELSHDAFCIAGFDGYLRRANPAFARSLGYTLEELLARPFMDNVYPDDVESVEAILAELAAGSDIAGFDCREVCADGSVRWFEWSTSSRSEDGVVYGVARDITERRLANAELSALRRVATLVAEEVQPAELFAVVAEEVARVVDVPRVSVARYELDGTARDCASFPPGAPVSSVAKRWSLGGTNLTIDQRLQDSVEVGAYYVVSEALTNAAKHSRATQVVVSGQTDDHTLSLSIHDDGIGGADMGNGSGLVGLADRVEALGGRMRIKSPAGRGTSLEATIPLDGT